MGFGIDSGPHLSGPFEGLLWWLHPDGLPSYVGIVIYVGRVTGSSILRGRSSGRNKELVVGSVFKGRKIVRSISVLPGDR